MEAIEIQHYSRKTAIVTFAALVRVLPPEALFFNGGSFGGRANVLAGVRGAVRFAECVAARNKRHLRGGEKW